MPIRGERVIAPVISTHALAHRLPQVGVSIWWAHRALLEEVKLWLATCVAKAAFYPLCPPTPTQHMQHLQNTPLHSHKHTQTRSQRTQRAPPPLLETSRDPCIVSSASNLPHNDTNSTTIALGSAVLIQHSYVGRPHCVREMGAVCRVRVVWVGRRKGAQRWFFHALLYVIACTAMCD